MTDLRDKAARDALHLRGICDVLSGVVTEHYDEDCEQPIAHALFNALCLMDAERAQEREELTRANTELFKAVDEAAAREAALFDHFMARHGECAGLRARLAAAMAIITPGQLRGLADHLESCGLKVDSNARLLTSMVLRQQADALAALLREQDREARWSHVR
jgi:hypothetical protein